MTVKTIILRGATKGINKEGFAGGAITPGMLVETNATGKVVAHATASALGKVMPAFAREREMTGDGIDKAYVADDTTLYTVLPSGAEVFALMEAGHAAVAVGAKLESAGDGTFQAKTTAGFAIAQAIEAAATNTAAFRIKVVIL